MSEKYAILPLIPANLIFFANIMPKNHDCVSTRERAGLYPIHAGSILAAYPLGSAVMAKTMTKRATVSITPMTIR